MIKLPTKMAATKENERELNDSLGQCKAAEKEGKKEQNSNV